MEQAETPNKKMVQGNDTINHDKIGQKQQEEEESKKDTDNTKDQALRNSIRNNGDSSTTYITYFDIDEDELIVRNIDQAQNVYFIGYCFTPWLTEYGAKWWSYTTINILEETNMLVVRQLCDKELDHSAKRFKYVSRFISFDSNKGKLQHIQTITDNDKYNCFRRRISINKTRSLLSFPISIEKTRVCDLYSYTQPNFMSKNPCVKLLKNLAIDPQTSIIKRALTTEFSPNGQHVALNGSEVNLEIYDVNTSNLLLSKSYPMDDYNSTRGKLCKWIHEGSKVFLVPDDSGEMHLIDSETGADLVNRRIDHNFVSMEYSPLSRDTILMGADDGMIRLYDVRASVDKRMQFFKFATYDSPRCMIRIDSVQWNPKNMNDILAGSPSVICIVDIRMEGKPRFEVSNSSRFRSPKFI